MHITDIYIDITRGLNHPTKQFKMKIFVSFAVITALLAGTSCSEQEIITEIPAGPDQSELALGVSTGVKATKSIVEGEAIKYLKNKYTDQPGMGIVVMNSEGTDFYGKKDPTLAKSHVWFIGDEKGENWQSISALGTTFATAVTKVFPLNDEVGTVYAYYPKAADDKLSGTTADALELEVPLLAADTIKFTNGVTNAELKFNTKDTSWTSNSTTLQKVLVAAGKEVDYLYSEENEGRYVNSGRAGEGVDAGVAQGNADNVNPGREIKLSMLHGLSMISFRVYNDGSLPGAGKLTKIAIRNAADKTTFISTPSTMNLSTGVITTSGNLTGDSIRRVITGYTIPKEVKSPEEKSDTTFIKTATITGPKVARKISMLVYPIASIPENEIEVMLTIDGVDYPVLLPVAEAPEWKAGWNYLYTVCASERRLTVTEVKVTDWENADGGNIDL